MHNLRVDANIEACPFNKAVADLKNIQNKDKKYITTILKVSFITSPLRGSINLMVRSNVRVPKASANLNDFQCKLTFAVYASIFCDSRQVPILRFFHFSAMQLAGVIKFRINQDFLIEHSYILHIRSNFYCCNLLSEPIMIF